MMNNFWLNFLQKERRVHLQDTLYEMACISAVLYVLIPVSGMIAMLFPYPIGMDLELIITLSIISVFIGITFYLKRNSLPVWFAVSHVFFGIPLVAVVVWAGHTPATSILAIIYIASSLYAFHFFNFIVGSGVILLASFFFALVAQMNHWQGWQSMTVIFMGCLFSVGIIVNLMVKRLHALATTDSLTGLFNRHTWDTLFEQELIYTTRSNTPLSIMLMDLNNFKAINDNQGHQAGDSILKQTAMAIKDVMRDSDVTARWGGDEFIILLRNCNLQQAKRLEGRLHERLNGLISASIGTTEYQQGDTSEMMLARADQFMYENKARQKNHFASQSVTA